jgi:hypothetical protein
MTLKQTQFLFTKGEVGPYMEARADTNIYKAGLRTCKNWLILPQGGLKRRPGFEFIDDLPTTAGADTGFSEYSRLVPFNFGNEQEYVLVWEPGAIHVYKDDFHQTSITSGVPFTSSNISEVRFAQTLDTMIIVHPEFRPYKLVRGASHTSWTLSVLDFDYVPLTNFAFDSGINVTAVANHSNGEPNVSFGANIQLDINGGSYQWTNSNWPDGHVNMHIQINGGTAKIHQVNSSSRAYCTVDEEMVNDDDVLRDEWDIDAFSNLSATYGGGWPRTVTFHQNRLIFGGSRDKPQTVFGSQSASYFNFKPTTKSVEIEKTTTTTGGNSSVSTEEHIKGSVTDDAGFAFTMASDEVNIITHLVSVQQLFIFASGGEWLLEGSPVTPTSVNITKQTNYGILNNQHRPIMIDTEAMFLSSNTELRAFTYNYNTDGYQAKNYTLVSHHIINTPKDMAYVRGFSDTNSNYVFVVNGNGEMACMSINIEKDVLGWSRIVTDGQFHSVCEVDNTLYALVKRTINGGTRIYLEKMTDAEYYVDCYLKHTGSSITNFTMNFLPNETVRVVADQSVQANITLNANGEGTLSSAASNVAVGLHYDSAMETLPTTIIVAQQYSQRGENITKKRADLILNNTQNITFDGFDVPFETFNSTTINATPTTYTGTKVVYLTGSGPDLTISANVDEPLKCTLLGATVEYKLPLGTQG